MKGRTPQEFLDGLSLCQELVFVYRGRTMCVQGWAEEDERIMFKLEQWQPWLSDEHLLWMHRAAAAAECVDAFVAVPLFDGRTFWEAENEIEVVFA